MRSVLCCVAATVLCVIVLAKLSEGQSVPALPIDFKIEANFTGFGSANPLLRAVLATSGEKAQQYNRAITILSKAFLYVDPNDPSPSTVVQEFYHDDEEHVNIASYDGGNHLRSVTNAGSFSDPFVLSSKPVLSYDGTSFWCVSPDPDAVQSGNRSPFIASSTQNGQRLPNIEVCSSVETGSGENGIFLTALELVSSPAYGGYAGIAVLEIENQVCNVAIEGKSIALGAMSSINAYVFVFNMTSGSILDFAPFHSQSNEDQFYGQLLPVPGAPLGSVITMAVDIGNQELALERFSNIGVSMWRTTLQSISPPGSTWPIRLTNYSSHAKIMFASPPSSSIAITDAASGLQHYACSGSLFGEISLDTGSVSWSECIYDTNNIEFVGISQVVEGSRDSMFLIAGYWDCSVEQSLKLGFINVQRVGKLVSYEDDEEICGFVARYNSFLGQFYSAQSVHGDIAYNRFGLSVNGASQFIAATLTRGTGGGTFWITENDSIDILSADGFENIYDYLEEEFPYYGIEDYYDYYYYYSGGYPPYSLVLSEWTDPGFFA